MTRFANLDRVAGLVVLVVAVLAPLFVTTYWVSALLTQVLLLGIIAASLTFLSAFGGMVSLAQVAVYGIAGFALGNATTNGNTKGLNLGWDPWIGVILGLVCGTGIALVFGVLACRSFGIYFLMITLTFGVIANLFFGQVTSALGVRWNQRHSGSEPDRVGRWPSEPVVLPHPRARVALVRSAAVRGPDAVRTLVAGHPR